MALQPTKLERAVLDWIASRDSSLAARLASAQFVARNYTGHGFYAYLFPQAAGTWNGSPVSGPIIESSQLEAGGGSMLWLSGGEPHCLELYAFGDHFPEDLKDFSLRAPDCGP